MLLTGVLLQRYLLATAFTFGLLAFLGWLAAKLAARRGLTPLPAPTGRPTATPGFASLWRSLLNPASSTSGPAKITRLSTVMLTAHHQVHKIQDGRRTYLLVTGPQGTTVIASNLEASTPDLTHTAAPNGNFADDLPPEAYIAPRRPTLVDTLTPKIPARRR